MEVVIPEPLVMRDPVPHRTEPRRDEMIAPLSSMPLLRHETGIEQDDDTETVRRLARCGDEELVGWGIRLNRPVSPHLAARVSGVRIEMPVLLGRFPVLAEGADVMVVEGAGGALVPLNEVDLMIDFMCALALPVVVVARSTLGTINHTLLTVEAARSRRLSAKRSPSAASTPRRRRFSGKAN